MCVCVYNFQPKGLFYMQLYGYYGSTVFDAKDLSCIQRGKSNNIIVFEVLSVSIAAKNELKALQEFGFMVCMQPPISCGLLTKFLLHLKSYRREKSLEVSYVGCFTLSNILTFFLEPFILHLMRVVNVCKVHYLCKRAKHSNKNRMEGFTTIKSITLKMVNQNV